jgi:lysophospholipase L1-like esterase
MRQTVSTLSRWIALLLFAFNTACSDIPDVPKLAPQDVVVAFGDSLTYGTGASEKESYPAVLSQLIGRNVVRAGVPGETTEEGLKRLPRVLREHNPKLLILCLGGNDLLRRLDERRTSANLRAMVMLAREHNVAVLLVGVPRPGLFAGPPLYYSELASELKLPYEGESVKRVLYSNAMKSDAIHPNATGYRQIAEDLAALLRKSGAI